ncbi:Arm DNA-binding domain-containing protein [Bordetella petrii]|uniref:integrase arm-type DNA-binding domain-containing protein n=1 Tax=Bordetella petrii TaxID=94624 RepID=UPI0038B326B8
MFLLVNKPTGDKLWRWKYRLHGKENLSAIGSFPQVSLAGARAAREKTRALVKQGIHPAHEWQQIKQRNLEALEERKRARECSFAKVVQGLLRGDRACLCAQFLSDERVRIRKYLFPCYCRRMGAGNGVVTVGY